MNPLWSLVLAAVGITGLWLAGRNNKIGWLINLFAQVLWLAYGISTRQPGFIATAFAYSFVYGRNWWRWRQQEQAKAKTVNLGREKYDKCPNCMSLNRRHSFRACTDLWHKETLFGLGGPVYCCTGPIAVADMQAIPGDAEFLAPSNSVGADGIHPAPRGYKAMAQRFYTAAAKIMGWPSLAALGIPEMCGLRGNWRDYPEPLPGIDYVECAA